MIGLAKHASLSVDMHGNVALKVVPPIESATASPTLGVQLITVQIS